MALADIVEAVEVPRIAEFSGRIVGTALNARRDHNRNWHPSGRGPRGIGAMHASPVQLDHRLRVTGRRATSEQFEAHNGSAPQGTIGVVRGRIQAAIKEIKMLRAPPRLQGKRDHAPLAGRVLETDCSVQSGVAIDPKGGLGISASVNGVGPTVVAPRQHFGPLHQQPDFGAVARGDAERAAAQRFAVTKPDTRIVRWVNVFGV